VEGSRYYKLEPFSKLDVFENPSDIFFEGPSRLINDDTGETVLNFKSSGFAEGRNVTIEYRSAAPLPASGWLEDRKRRTR
jgi:hypothetical protein